MGREKESDSQGALHIPPGYIATEGFAFDTGTSEPVPFIVFHPAHTTLRYCSHDNRSTYWCLARPDVGQSEFRDPFNRSEPTLSVRTKATSGSPD